VTPALDHLRALDAAAVRLLLAARPDLVGGLPPESLPDLAERVESGYSVAEATSRLPATTLDVLEALVALALQDPRLPAVPQSRLAEFLEAESGERARWMAEAIAEAVRLVLVTPIVIDRRTDLHYVPNSGLLDQWYTPLGLPPPATYLLADGTATDLRRIATRLGLAPSRRKGDLVGQILDALADADRIRRIVSTAPAVIKSRLLAHAVGGAPLAEGYLYPPPRDYDWAIERGLLMPNARDTSLTMPGEVAFALRGRDYHAPLRPPVADPAAGVIGAEVLASDASAAVLALLGTVDRLIDLCAQAPPRTIKSGRVGTRELRRVAKALDLTLDGAEEWIDIAMAAGLLDVDDGAVLPTPLADEWRASVPAERVSAVLLAWWRLHGPGDLPRVVLEYLSALPTGTAVDGTEALGTYLAWRHPRSRPAAIEAGSQPTTGSAAEALAELTRIGLVARGAATQLGRVLAAKGGPDAVALADAATPLTPTTVATATFQSDLSALVAGIPAPKLAEALDRAGRLEGRGTASTWRFDAASIRAAMDAGDTADEILVVLRDASASPLPQTLEYLIKDVARRYGAARVAPVGSCVTSDDAALLAEIRVTRSLAALRFRALAPTVLASPADPDEVLAALRGAGFAPAREDESGDVVLESRARPRATRRPSTRGRGGGVPIAVPEIDLDKLATHLVATPDAPPQPNPSKGTLAELGNAVAVPPSGRRLLAHAIDRGEPVEIDYINAAGNRTTRVIEDMVLDGPYLIGWCTLRQDERVFSLSRIQAVRTG
jgi:hypothetical protein